jgi:hypothetical protein
MSTAPMKIDLHALETALPHTDRDVQDSLTRSGDQPDWPRALHAVLALRGLVRGFHPDAPNEPGRARNNLVVARAYEGRFQCPEKTIYMLPDEDSVYVATGICSMPEEDRAPRPVKVVHGSFRT